MLGRGRRIGAMALLGLTQQFGQRIDVQAQTSTRKPGLDFLEHPPVTVRVVEGGPGAVGIPSGIAPAQTAVRSPDVKAVLEMENVTHRRAVLDQRGPSQLDVGNDEECSLNRAWRGRGDALAEYDRAG